MTCNRNTSKHLFLSSHLDDAVLSCGALIYNLTRSGARVEILTVFAGLPNPSLLSNLAKRFHQEWGLGDDAIKVRRAEDRRAARHLGASTIQMNLLDCVYRGDEIGGVRYHQKDDIFQGNLFEETDTLNEIVVSLLDTVDIKSFSKIYLPLGIGCHIDHLLLKKAVESLLYSAADKIFPSLTYYEDLPYACLNQHNWQVTPGKKLYPNLQFIDAEAWKAKVDAILFYESQIEGLWASIAEMENQLSAYALKVGLGKPAERFWINF